MDDLSTQLMQTIRSAQIITRPQSWLRLGEISDACKTDLEGALLLITDGVLPCQFFDGSVFVHRADVEKVVASQMTETMQTWMTLGEVADACNNDLKGALLLITEGFFPCKFVDGSVFVLQTDVEAFIASCEEDDCWLAEQACCLEEQECLLAEQDC